MFVSYPVNPLLVQRCPVMSISFGFKFLTCSKLSTDKMDRDARLMYSHYMVYMLHKSLARVLSVRGDEFCHQITKFCMFCPFSLCNKSVFWSDQALYWYYRFILSTLSCQLQNEGCTQSGEEHHVMST